MDHPARRRRRPDDGGDADAKYSTCRTAKGEKMREKIGKGRKEEWKSGRVQTGLEYKLRSMSYHQQTIRQVRLGGESSHGGHKENAKALRGSVCGIFNADGLLWLV